MYCSKRIIFSHAFLTGHRFCSAIINVLFQWAVTKCVYLILTQTHIFFFSGWKSRKVDKQTNEKNKIVYMNLVNLLPCTLNFAHIFSYVFFIIRFDIVQQSNRHFKNIHAISSGIWKEKSERESQTVYQRFGFIECVWLCCVYISEIKNSCCYQGMIYSKHLSLNAF